MLEHTLIVYPAETHEPGVEIPVFNGFVSRVVSAVAEHNIPDAQRVATILNNVEQQRKVGFDLAEWCRVERQKLAVDGYDYKSGEEHGLRRAEIEIEKRLAEPSVKDTASDDVK